MLYAYQMVLLSLFGILDQHFLVLYLKKIMDPETCFSENFLIIVCLDEPGKAIQPVGMQYANAHNPGLFQFPQVSKKFTILTARVTDPRWSSIRSGS